MRFPSILPRPYWILCLPVLQTAAQSPSVTSTAPQPSNGLANDWLRMDSKAFQDWDLGGQFRARLEHRDHFAISGVPGSTDFTGNASDTSNGYGLFRTKVHIGYKPTPWIQAYVEGRDSATVLDDRSPSSDADRTDLHQAWLRITSTQSNPVSLKVGRQELSFGEERLVGAFDWNNVGRVFDAARAQFQSTGVTVDGFAGRIVLPDDHTFNVANDYDWFSGIHASSKTLVPHQEAQVYFFARNVSLESPTALGTGLPALLNGASPRDIYTAGARAKSLPESLNGWDYSVEAAYQFGRFKDSATSASLEHQAFSSAIAGGYTFKDAAWKPRVGLGYDFATGDSNPNDDRHETFENLFPTNHKFYGFMDFFSWQNLHDVRLSASIRPSKAVLITADYHGFWMADTHDSLYAANGTRRGGIGSVSGPGFGIRSANSDFIGSEVDLIGTWTPASWGSIQTGYGHFFTGKYIEESVAQPRDADWVYAQVTLTF